MSKGITSPKGFMAAAGKGGVKPSGKPDLALIVADRPCAAAGVFTRSRMPSAPVLVCKRHLRSSHVQAIVCNSGNANAATGELGKQHALTMCEQVATHAGVKGANPRLVMPSSTGIIGQHLPIESITDGITRLSKRLKRGPATDLAVAEAMMSTDLVPKLASASFAAGANGTKRALLGGVCKGSGMIAPNMGTMLAFTSTDADVPAPLLRSALRAAVAASFNRTSVDQHTSPSDTVLLLASGAANTPRIDKQNQAYTRFTDALTDLCRDLAYQIVKDGEGASRVMRVRVNNARTLTDADAVGRAVVDSPLVKTALHGRDPNWGRIVTAAAVSGTPIRPASFTLSIGTKKSQVCVFRNGEPTPLTPATAKRLDHYMAQQEVVFAIDLGMGSHHAEWLGCDLSREYITINADYTT